MTTQYEQLLAEKGIALNDLGLKEVALCRSDALRAIQTLKSASVPILGGDVYFKHRGLIEPAYANWYADMLETESREEFAVRSSLKAANYIANFPERPGTELLFVLVLLAG